MVLSSPTPSLTLLGEYRCCARFPGHESLFTDDKGCTRWYVAKSKLFVKISRL